PRRGLPGGRSRPRGDPQRDPRARRADRGLLRLRRAADGARRHEAAARALARAQGRGGPARVRPRAQRGLDRRAPGVRRRALMDFELSDEQRLTQETVRAFVEERVLPVAIRNDIEHRLDLDLIGGLAELGILGIVIPEAYGGAG